MRIGHEDGNIKTTTEDDGWMDEAEAGAATPHKHREQRWPREIPLQQMKEAGQMLMGVTNRLSLRRRRRSLRDVPTSVSFTPAAS